MAVRSYQDLEVWREGIELAVQVYVCGDNFPAHECFGITSQLRRAAVSIPSNIAEGQGRSRKDFLRFLAIARGSLQEVGTLIVIVERLRYVSSEEVLALRDRADRVGRLLNGLRRALMR